MKPHQERVVQERKDLDEKIDKLDEFIDGEIFKTLPKDEQDRLVVQSAAMTNYSDILYARINAFED
jgi:hypothetical protein